MNWVRSVIISMILLFGVLFGAVRAAQADSAVQGRYASIIVDADAHDILHARQIDAQRHPASLTKIMTLYLTFEAIDDGRLSLEDVVTVSAAAAQTPPVSMGLRRAEPVRISTLIQAVAVRSANDAAVALAEAVGGTEAEFVQRMNDKAQQLQLTQTLFRNPHGLPDPQQVTTARDMAKLAVATLNAFPHHYHYFGQTHFRGRKNTNELLLTRPDVDGFKTGYTRASGYNLVISATRGTNRIIAVVLGGASSGSRNRHMSDLIDRGFEVIGQTPARLTVANASTPQPSGPLDWALQIDGFASPAEAEILSHSLVMAAGQGEVGRRQRQLDGQWDGQRDYSIRVNAIDQATARHLCSRQAEILKIEPRRCKVLSIANPG